MLIKYPSLASHLKNKTYTLIILQGEEPYLRQEATRLIKKVWQANQNSDEKIITIYRPDEWPTLINEANTYSLFSEKRFIQAYFDKKSLDKTAKNNLISYLNKPNDLCLIVLHLEHISVKQLQDIAKHPSILIVSLTPFSTAAFEQWIKECLQQEGLSYTAAIPSLLYQYTQGNMLAAKQAIEHLRFASTQTLTVDDLLAQLIDQSQFEVYELADAYLNANNEHAIHILRQLHNTHIEPTLVLWWFTYDIRQLLSLAYLSHSRVALNSSPLSSVTEPKVLSFSKACQQLDIRPQRIKSYEVAMARLTIPLLQKLLSQCALLDEQIKTNQGENIWDMFERLTLSLCLGKLW